MDFKTKGKARPEERKYHLALVSEDHMYIIGGHRGSHTDHVRDVFAINLWSLVWKRIAHPVHDICKMRSNS